MPTATKQRSRRTTAPKVPHCGYCGEKHHQTPEGCSTLWRVLGQTESGSWEMVFAHGSEKRVRLCMTWILDNDEPRYEEYVDFKVLPPDGTRPRRKVRRR